MRQIVSVRVLGEAVGVGEQEVAALERDLAADVTRIGVEEQQRPRGAQWLHLAVVPQPARGVTG